VRIFSKRDGIVDQHRVDLDAKALEHDEPSQVGRASWRVERHLAASEVFYGLEFLARIDVHLGEVERGNVLDALVYVVDLHLAPEMLEHIGLRDRDVDAVQIEQVGYIADRAVGDHGRTRRLLPSSSTFAMSAA
jgi:hypothetical protein